MLKNKFLLYPVILFVLLFAFDKLFLLDKIKPYIKTDFTHIYYETRNSLVDLIANDEEIKTHKKKFMLILGSSRLLYFDAQELKAIYPDWTIYNLSSAVTTPAYYDYYLERVLATGVTPDFILLETDANQFNANSPVFKGSNLTYSFDLGYVFKYADLFGKDNVSFFLGKQLFAVGKNKPYFDTALKRMLDPNFSIFVGMQERTKDFLLENRGHSLPIVESFVEKDFSSLEATSKRTFDWVYSSYKHSDMQYSFYDILLKKISDKKIPLVIVLPQASIPLQKLLDEAPFMENWKSRVLHTTKKYGFRIRDMRHNPESYCNAFVDGGHISKDCYHPFMRYVMTEYFREIKKETSPTELH